MSSATSERRPGRGPRPFGVRVRAMLKERPRLAAQCARVSTPLSSSEPSRGTEHFSRRRLQRQTPDSRHRSPSQSPNAGPPRRPLSPCSPAAPSPKRQHTKYVREHARAASGQRTGLQTQKQPPARAATLRGRLAISAGAAWSRRRPGRSLTSPICLPPARPYRGVASAHIRRRGIVVTSLRGRTGNPRAHELMPYSSWTAPGDPRDARPPSEAGRPVNAAD